MTFPVLNCDGATDSLVRGSIEKLEREVAELTLAVAARDTFISVAGHELRNPMMPIIGQIDLLLTTVQAGRASPEQIEERLVRIQKAATHYVKRASILLDVSRITSGRLQLQFERFDFTAMLRELAREFADLAERAGSLLTLDLPERLIVNFDRLAVEQIMDNLISNAIKYGSHTPVGIMAREEDGRLHIEVRDGGVGIVAADRERVFSRFERVVGVGERRSGFGLGLWVVGQLVTAMSGTVTVADAPGGGALFTVTLPQSVGGERP